MWFRKATEPLMLWSQCRSTIAVQHFVHHHSSQCMLIWQSIVLLCILPNHHSFLLPMAVWWTTFTNVWLPLPMDESPSLTLLKLRIPRKTIITDPSMWEYPAYICTEHHLSPFRFTDYIEFQIHNLHCPLWRGIIYYRQDDAIFEHNIHSPRKHEVNSYAAHWESCTTH